MDLLPVEFIRELSKLQDEVPPFDYADAERTLEKELSAPVGELFAQLNKAGKSLSESPVSAEGVGGLVDLIADAGVDRRWGFQSEYPLGLYTGTRES